MMTACSIRARAETVDVILDDMVWQRGSRRGSKLGCQSRLLRGAGTMRGGEGDIAFNRLEPNVNEALVAGREDVCFGEAEIDVRKSFLPVEH